MFALPRFHDRQLSDTAFTHRSYLNEHSEVKEHNERLEFLGDALLNFLSGEFLYKRYPEKAEGELTPLRAALVEEGQLAKFAEFLEIGKLLRMAKGTELNGGRQNACVQATVPRSGPCSPAMARARRSDQAPG